MIVELIGGYIAGSLALMSDAAHMLTDFISLIFSVIAIILGRRPKDSRMSFGYKKAEAFGALFNGLLLWLISGFLIYYAILRMQDPEPVKGPLVACIAVIGLISNLISLKILRQSQKENINMRGAFLHVLSDLLGSVGALIAGVVIWMTGWFLIDPILTIIFTALILGSAWNMIKESLIVLMDGVPLSINYDEVEARLISLGGVLEIHDLHLWSLSDKSISLSVHIVSREGSDTLKKVTDFLKDQYKINHVTIQIEDPDKFASKSC